MVDLNPSFSPTPEMIIGFILVTLVFLVVSMLVLRKAQCLETKLILLGLVVAVAGVGYSSIVSGGAVAPAQTIMKIGFLLVLGGVACSVLSHFDRTKSDKVVEAEVGHETQA